MGCLGCCEDKDDKSESETASTNENIELIEKLDNGQPRNYDPKFKGPIENRSCTDIICFVLFIVCFLAMLAVGVFAYTRGNPELLLYPTDSQGKLCGVGEHQHRPYLFFFDLLQCARVGPALLVMGCPTPQVCVSQCPNVTWVWSLAQNIEDSKGSPSFKVRKHMYCKDGIKPTTTQLNQSVQALVEDDDCAAYYVPSEPIVGRCVPSIFKEGLDLAGSLTDGNNSVILDKAGAIVNGTELEGGMTALATLLNVKDTGMKIFQDVRASWWMILVGLGLAMVIAFIWIVLLRWIAGPMVWLTIILFIALFGFGTGYSIYKYVNMKDNPAHQGSLQFTTNLSYYWNLATTWLIFGIVAGVILLIVLLVLLFLRSRIKIAIALVKETSRGISNMIFTLFWPMIPFLLQVVLFGFWGASAMYLATMGQAQYAPGNGTFAASPEVKQAVDSALEYTPCGDNNNHSICQFLAYGGDQYTIYLQIFQLFMLFWVMNFIIALGQVTLAGAFASYYFAFTKPQDIPTFPVTGALWRALRYHLGSIAFGALIIAIIQLIRVMLEYIDHKLKGSENAVAKFLMKCLKCCFWCLEKIVKFINKNAYIIIAIYGKNFCSAAKDAFFLIVRNIVRVAVVDKITDFILFIGKLVVVGAVGAAAFFFFDGQIPVVNEIIDKPELNYFLVPVIIIIVGTYVIASGFFSVYDMGVDTMFLCFLEDLERNDGSPEKPYYMSKELKNIMDVKNEMPSEKD